VLAGDACSRPPIIIKSHDLHAGHIRRAMGEIASTTKWINSFPFLLVLAGYTFGLSLAFLFCFPCDGSNH